MVEEKALTDLQCGYQVHIRHVQIKIKYVEVLPHSFLTYGLWNHDDVSLCQPPENDLSNSLTVLFCNRYQDCVMKDIVLPLGERTPRFDLDVVFLEKLLG